MANLTITVSKLTDCPYPEPCCMRTKGKCTALADTYFKDFYCHFRKERQYGPNEYDLMKKRQEARNAKKTKKKR